MGEDEAPQSENYGTISARPNGTNSARPMCEQEQPILDEPATKMYGILIEPLDYGFTVKIGCQKFAIETKERLIEKLSQYINNPKDVEKKWSRSKEI